MSERQREQEGINIGKKSDLNMLSSLSSAHFTTLAHIYSIFRLPFSPGSLTLSNLSAQKLEENTFTS